MRLHHTILVFCLMIMSTWAQAYELITIQAVSDTKRTFITRNGKRQGVQIGMTGTFTAEDVSILAKAINVTGAYAQWQIVNPEARLPFEKGTIVTWYPATEYLWALSPESERQKYIKSQLAVPRTSWVFKGALTRGISESVSSVDASNPKRGGYLAEVFYEKGLTYSLAFDVGLRYEREAINYTGVSFVTKRNIAMTNLIYYFDNFRELLSGGRIYIGGGLGYGLSNTTTVGLAQSGPVLLLPAIKLGVTLPFTDDWEFLLDNSFESLQTSEENEEGKRQTTTQTNYKFGFGLRRYF